MSSIVVGYVPKPEGRAAIQRAAAEAKLRGSTMIVVNSNKGGRELEPEEAVQIEEAMAAIREDLDAAGIGFEMRQLVRGMDVAEDLIAVAEESGAEMIVIGLRRRSPVGKLILGSNAQTILLDAPCSASGIVRRHPDAKWLRRRGDIATLVQRQRGLLAALWPLLRVGGKLLYVTCSVFPDEGEAVVEHFVASHPDSVRLALHWQWPDGGREVVAQLLPRSTPGREHDGFFYACLTKRP